MLNFFKHHWSRREKAIAKIRSMQVALGLLLGLLLAAFVIIWQLNKDQSRVTEMHHAAQTIDAHQTVPPNGTAIGGPFTLTNQDGKTITEKSFPGKYLLIYFGYTYCPDMCPTGLQGIARMLDLLGKDASKVQPLFITIDPDRDTAVKLKEYVASFHPQIMALRGTPAQIASAAKAYQVYYARGEQVDDNDYVMDHSSLMYLIGPDGKFITTFDDESDPAVMAKALEANFAGPKKR